MIKGSKHSKESIEKLRISHLGKSHVVSEETRKKIGLINKGKKFSEEYRKKLSIAHLGHSPGNKGMKMKPLSEEHKKKQSDSLKKYYATHVHHQKGNPTWNKGFHFSSEVKDKMSKARKEYYKTHDSYFKGKHLPEETRKKIGLANKGHKHTEEAKRNISLHIRGEQHYNWKGGLSILVKEIRRGLFYREWRMSVYRRDFFQCTQCGSRKDIHAHHLTSFTFLIYKYGIKSIEEAENCAELWDINNGRTLCKKCHEKTDGYMKSLTSKNQHVN